MADWWFIIKSPIMCPVLVKKLYRSLFPQYKLVMNRDADSFYISKNGGSHSLSQYPSLGLMLCCHTVTGSDNG